MEEKKSDLIDAKDAANVAAKYYRNFCSGDTVFSVEEIEHRSSEGLWLITL